MKKIKIIFMGLFVVVSLLNLNTAFAQNCPDPSTPFCNPSQDFFFDLEPVGGENTFTGVLEFIIERVILPIAGTIAMLFIIIGGFQYMSARGNEEQASAGRKTLVNAIIGLAIVLISYTIVVVIFNLFTSGPVGPP